MRTNLCFCPLKLSFKWIYWLRNSFRNKSVLLWLRLSMCKSEIRWFKIKISDPHFSFHIVSSGICNFLQGMPQKCGTSCLMLLLSTILKETWMSILLLQKNTIKIFFMNSIWSFWMKNAVPWSKKYKKSITRKMFISISCHMIQEISTVKCNFG